MVSSPSRGASLPSTAVEQGIVMKVMCHQIYPVTSQRILYLQSLHYTVAMHQLHLLGGRRC